MGIHFSHPNMTGPMQVILNALTNKLNDSCVYTAWGQEMEKKLSLTTGVRKQQ